MNDWLPDLLKTAFGKKVADAMANRIVQEDYPVRLLIDHTFHPVKEMAFRASWILEQVVSRQPEWFMQGVAYFVERYPMQTDFSCQRSYTKIMMEMTRNTKGNPYTAALQGIGLEPVINSTFEWLIHPGTPVAVQVNCLDILFYQKDDNDWIADELRMHIPFLLRNGSPAMQSRGKRILAKL